MNVNIPIVTKPICATEEYAISFLISSCAIAIKEVYIIAITERTKTRSVKTNDPIGNSGIENLNIP